MGTGEFDYPYPGKDIYEVSTTPITHELCGELTYTVKYENDVVGTLNDPTDVLSYDPVSQDFTVDTDDQALIGLTKNYSVDAEFATYPLADYSSVSTDAETSTILFIDPCVDNVTTFTQASWPSMGEDRYSSTEVESSLNAWTVVPSICTIDYTCNDIIIDGVSSTKVSCGDITFEEPAPGVPGKVSIVATPSDYENKTKPPGDYEIEICGQITGSNTA